MKKGRSQQSGRENVSPNTRSWQPGRNTLAEACCHLEWAQWERAIEEEIATLKAASTWRLKEPPLGANVISSKWVFKAKKDTSGRVIHYKVCLVVQGFS